MLMSGSYDLLVSIKGQSFQEIALFVATRPVPAGRCAFHRHSFVLRTYKRGGVLYQDEEIDEESVRYCDGLRSDSCAGGQGNAPLRDSQVFRPGRRYAGVHLLGVGEPDFKTPWAIRDAAIRTLQQGRTRYTANAGMKELRVEICNYLARRFGLHYSPDDQVLVTVGGSEAIDMATAPWSSRGTRSSSRNPALSVTSPSHPSPAACRCTLPPGRRTSSVSSPNS